MPLINTSVTNLIQGVSQQPDAVRFSGQCEEQENALASVVDGLQKRPATRHIATLIADAEIDDTAKVHFIERDNDERYVVIIKGSTTKTISAYNLENGTQATINQKYRGVVSNFWIDPFGAATASATFTKPLPIPGATYVPSDGHTVRVVGGGSLSSTEHTLTSVHQGTGRISFKPQTAPSFDSSFTFFGANTGAMQSVIEYTIVGP